MKPDKPLNEAMFRSHLATEKANQAQHQLYNMSNNTQSQEDSQSKTSKAELNESHQNLLQSWHTLRKLDEALAEKKAGGNMKGNKSKGSPANK